jgi:hypothetical protein
LPPSLHCGLQPDPVLARLSRRHWAGLQRLDMDELASLYYGEPMSGAGYALWRARVYLTGFFF